MDYFKNKEENKKRAIRLFQDNEKKYGTYITNCYHNSMIYREDTNFMCNNANPNMAYRTMPNLILVDITADEAVLKYKECALRGERVAVLNFSSYKNPGGMFFEGSMAQEEALCHHSILANVLIGFDIEFYSRNRKDLNKGLYKNRAIYSKDVLFFDHHGKPATTCDVITCAAPNKGPGIRYGNITKEENTEALRSRINFIIRLADANQVGVLILGAYGCGVFKQDPYEVVKIFEEELYSGRHYARQVIFAIPDFSSKNYKAFEKVLYYNAYI